MKIYKTFVVVFEDDSRAVINEKTQRAIERMLNFLVDHQNGRLHHPDTGATDVVSRTKTGNFVVNIEGDGVLRYRHALAWAQPYLEDFENYLKKQED